jgi:hypothetical protein
VQTVNGQDWATVGNKRKKRNGVPTCTNPACRQPRIPPAVFCDDCLAEGYVEEAA